MDDTKTRRAPDPDAMHRKFAGDATGAIGNNPMYAEDVAEDTATMANAAMTPEMQGANPGKSSNDLRDAGYEAEEVGSALAHEREGMPTGDMPQNIPDSAGETRKSAPNDDTSGRSGKSS